MQVLLSFISSIFSFPKSLLHAGFFIALTLLPGLAHAGAWTQDKGDWQAITTMRAYQTSSRFTDAGDKTSQPRYRQLELNPYVEYGLTNEWTLGANFFLQHIDDSSDKTTGIADTELFARYQLFRNEDYAIAIQPMVKLPSPQARGSSPAIGSRYGDAGVNILTGMNFEAFGRKHYTEADVGYRVRTGPPADQMLFGATVGLNVTDELTILPQVFHTQRMELNTPLPTTLSPRDDYTLTRAQLTGLYELDDARAIQAGAFYNVDGRNTGQGGGLLIGLWTRF